MNKLEFMLEDCSKQMARQHLRAVAGGYAVPHYTKTQYIKDVADLICMRKVSGVRYLGKEEIANRVKTYVETRLNKFFQTLDD